MSFVAQAHNPNGCALAAIASVTNLDYNQALERLRRKSFNPNNGIIVPDIRKCLIRLGRSVPPIITVPRDKRNRKYINKTLADIKKSCILIVDNCDEYLPYHRGTCHCVVWDRKTKKFWDPGDSGHFGFWNYADVIRIIIVP